MYQYNLFMCKKVLEREKINLLGFDFHFRKNEYICILSN